MGVRSSFANEVYSNSHQHKIREEALEQILKSLVQGEGTLYSRAGSGSHENAQYENMWFRDQTRTIIGIESLPADFKSENLGLATGSHITIANKLRKGLFEALSKFENRMLEVIRNPEAYSNSFCLPPRLSPETLEELPGEWSNTQESQWLGEFLLINANWLTQHELRYARIYQMAAEYLVAIKPFDRPTSNAWEEAPALYTSNMGASLAGLNAARKFGVPIAQTVIDHGIQVLEERISSLRETDNRKADLALLSLVYPAQIVSTPTARRIVKLVNEELGMIDGVPRMRGFARYKGDQYQGLDGLPGPWNQMPNTAAESEWHKGFSLMATALSFDHEAKDQFAKVLEAAVDNRVGTQCVEQFVPVLKNGNPQYRPENIMHIPRNPLTWSAAALLTALY